MARGKNTGTSITAAQRRQQALTLRRGGATFEEIGTALGCSRQRAHILVSQELIKIKDEVAGEADQVRTLELLRLDRLFMGSWNKAIGGNKDAVANVLKVMERRARILGIDAPAKLAPTTPDGQDPYESLSESELDRRITEKLAKYAGKREAGSAPPDRTAGSEIAGKAGRL